MGVAAAAGIGGWWLSSAQRNATSRSVAIETAKTGGTGMGIPTSTAPQKLVTLKIAASPPDSEISLDGAKLDANPFTAQFPKDPALRRLEVRCYGRVTEARMIRLDQDLDLLIALSIDRTLAPQRRGFGSPAAAAAAGGKAGAKHPPAPAPGAPAPGAPAPGTPAPGTPAPGTPAPGTPAPGTPAPGALTPGALTPGALTPGALTPGAPIPETLTHRESDSARPINLANP